MHWSEVWFDEGFGPKLIRLALTPGSWAYTLAWNSYAALYGLGIKKAAHPHGPVICIGNLTVGGTGKTPLTLYLTKLIQSLGYEIAISCSGYGSPASAQATIAPIGDLSALMWSDEAALFRIKLPEVPLIVGRDRVRAARLCHETYSDRILLMDDGIQHLPLYKDVTILIDTPGSNLKCLPAGPYREPSKRRNRANLVLPGNFRIESAGMYFIDAKSGLSAVRPIRANVLCAIGAPDSLILSLEQLGVELGCRVIKPDHDPLQEGNLFQLLPVDQPVIVTEKDWVKLRERRDLEGRRIFIARREVVVQPEAQFIQWVQDKLHEVNAKRI